MDQILEVHSLGRAYPALREVLVAVRARRVLGNWEAVVGSQLAKVSRPEQYVRGTLTVAVASGTWAQELRMREETILRALNKAAAESRRPLFQQIRFSVRPMRRAETTPSTGSETASSAEKGLPPVDYRLSISEIVAIRREQTELRNRSR